MDLLIDSGNSRIKWATFDGVKLLPGAAIDRGSKNYEDQLRKMLTVVSNEDDARQGSIFISDVSNRVDDNIISRLERLSPTTPVTSLSASAQGYEIKNCYQDPQTLGSDRWAALIGAHHGNDGDLVVLDCGTAITVDGLRADGTFIGGMILPSAWLGEQALSDGTSLINRDSWTTDARPETLGRSTGSCVQRGAALAAMGGVQLAVDTVMGELSKPCSIIVTGGDALTYIDLLPDCALHDRDLVLRGLSVVAADSH